LRALNNESFLHSMGRMWNRWLDNRITLAQQTTR
jgi:hypothetical protein